MQYYSGPPNGVSDVQQLVLAAASHHMLLSDGPSHHHFLHHYHQQQQQQLYHHHQQCNQSSLQSQDFLDFYHRQAVGLPEQEMQGSHVLLGLNHHHHQELHTKAPSLLDTAVLQLPLSHHVSLGSESVVREASSPRHLNHHYQAAAVEEFAVDLAVEGNHAEDPSLGSSRWAREETAALLRVRTEMDALFRDPCAAKGALWSEVSRRLRGAGFERSARSCKETLENVQNYFEKTMEGNPEAQDRKEYTGLEVFCASGPAVTPADISAIAAVGDSAGMADRALAASDMKRFEETMLFGAQETSTEPGSPVSTSCGDACVDQHVRGRKRKRQPSWRSMRAFFQDLATQLMERQDAMHKKFLAAIERREEERQRREDAYKRQEMARLSKEQELRARERILAATRDAALVAFLQKVTGETLHLPEMASTVFPTDGGAMAAVAAAAATAGGEFASTPSGEDFSAAECMKEGGVDANSRRWPKAEVLALIRVRTDLEPRFQEAGPKAQLWEEVSTAMASLGFRRSSKRCKEKWENINKYFRKTKDNLGRKLRADSASKTCPYFHQLELLYERGILVPPSNNKAIVKFDGLQSSQDLLESSREESQHTHEVNGCGNFALAQLHSGISVNNMPLLSNLQSSMDGANVAVNLGRFPISATISSTNATTCSNAENGGSFCNGVRVQDVDALRKPGCRGELGCLLSPADQINVNCYPPQQFTGSDGSHDGQLSHEEQMTCNSNSVTHGGSSGSQSQFVKKMMEVQQHSMYGSHHLEADPMDHASTRMEMENAGAEQDAARRITSHGALQLASDAAAGAHSPGFDLSSPDSSCGQV